MNKKKKRKTWLFLGVVEEKVCCRYEEDPGRRHLGERRLNRTSKTEPAGYVRRSRDGEGKREEAGALAKWAKKRLVTKMAGLIGKSLWGRAAEPLGWRSLR